MGDLSPIGILPHVGMTITHDSDANRVSLINNNGTQFTIAPYHAHDHRRGAFVVGDVHCFKVSKRTLGKILQKFFPDCSLRYLEKFGYIAY